MKILVNSREAVLKKDFSFDYVSENRLFLGRDGYTLNITFPLAGCPENIEIFGYIHRLDADKENLQFECSIIDGEVSLNGSLCITKVSATEIEGQFSEGRCEQTATDPFEDVLVNELDLGMPPSGSFTPEQAWAGIDLGNNEVALPWINESSATQFNNWVLFEDGIYKWDKKTYGGRIPDTAEPDALPGTALSWQPYLIHIAKKICEAIGYTCNFTAWEESGYHYLIICNTLPYTWNEGELRNYKSVMPKWTVSEFFSKLELLLMGEFDFDHRAKHVDFAFTKDVLSEIAPVEIADVVDEYYADIVTDGQSCDYIGSKRLSYKECEHSMQPYYACDWFMPTYGIVKRYANISAVIEANKLHTLVASNGNQYEGYGDGAELVEPRNAPPYVRDATYHLMYAISEDTYFVFRSIGVRKNVYGRRNGIAQVYVLQPINVFGSGSEERDDVESEEIEFVPVCITDTYISEKDDKGYMMFLSFSSYDEDAEDSESEAGSIRQPLPASTIEDGKEEEKTGYYDAVYIGFWNGAVPNRGQTPYPMLDTVNVTQDWKSFSSHMPDLRLKKVLAGLPSINPKQKFKFSWLGNSIPSPRAIFYIKGKRYLCEKVTATFTENGMSQLLKGEFYPLLDD